MLLNSYSYQVIRNAAGIPVHLVDVLTAERSGCAAFSDAAAARDYILRECSGLAYDPDHTPPAAIIDAYKIGRPFSKISNRQMYVTR